MEWFRCTIWSYRTKRRHDLVRHRNSKHQSHQFATSLLLDVIASVVSPNMNVMVNTVKTNESLYEHEAEAAVIEAGDVAGKKAVEMEASQLEAVQETGL